MSNQTTYGIHAVKELLERRPSDVEEVFVLSGRIDKRMGEIVSLAERQGISVSAVDKKEIANLSSTQSPNADQSDLIARIQASSNDGSIDNSAGLSELKYYIVELMKDQNEIRQIVKDLREILEKNSDN